MLLAVFVAMVNGEALRRAQTEEMPDDLRIFLDCAARCDEDHIRRKIEIVTYVRNRDDADLHTLVTSQPSGSGGIVYTVQFIGQGVEYTVFPYCESTNQLFTLQSRLDWAASMIARRRSSAHAPNGSRIIGPASSHDADTVGLGRHRRLVLTIHRAPGQVQT